MVNERGQGVGPKFVPPVDRRHEGLTREGFKLDEQAILTRAEYELLNKVALAVNSPRTKRVFELIVPQYQKDADGVDLKDGRVRVIKGALYNGVFEPIRRIREEMIQKEASADEIEEAISQALEEHIERLNETSPESTFPESELPSPH